MTSLNWTKDEVKHILHSIKYIDFDERYEALEKLFFNSLSMKAEIISAYQEGYLDSEKDTETDFKQLEDAAYDRGYQNAEKKCDEKLIIEYERGYSAGMDDPIK